MSSIFRSKRYFASKHAVSLSLAFFIAVTIAVPIFAQQKSMDTGSSIKFEDVTKEAGLHRVTSGWSATFVDFDDDGWLDLHLINRHYERSVLYQNQENGTFLDVTDASGLRFQTSDGHVTWVDLDNDGDKDCLVAGRNQDALFLNNGDGTFTSKGSFLGRAGTGREGRLAVADFDRDGLVDIFACQTDGGPQRHPEDRSLLLKNLGEGEFQDVADSAGLLDLYDAYAAVVMDFTQDGWPDLIITRQLPPFLKAFENLGKGTFREVTEEVGLKEVKLGFLGAPVLSAMDLNHDGWIDLVTAGDSLRIFINQNGHFFYQPTHTFFPSSISLPIGFMEWGDINNDGLIDVFLPQANSTRIWLGRRDGKFEEVAGPLNFRGRDLSLGDYDNDGDLDVFSATGGGVLYRNDSPPRSWLKIGLRGTTSNADGLGSRVTLFAGDLQRMVEVNISTKTESKASGDIHFGLRDRSFIDTLRIRWPSGQVQQFNNLQVNQRLAIKEPKPALFEEVAAAAGISGALQTGGAAFGDYDNDGYLDLAVNAGPGMLFHNNTDGRFTDITEKVEVYIVGRPSAGVAWGDFNNDGLLDLFFTHTSDKPHRLLLYNQGGTFVDVSSKANIARPGNGGPALLADFDDNGYLDVLIPCTSSEPVQLFFNQGDTTFIENGREAGFGNLGYKQLLTGCTGDYDNDGDIDIYLVQTNWSYLRHDSPNYLFRNLGDGTFEDVTAESGVADSTNSKGAIFGDYNNDGFLDLYVVNDGGDNRLFQNNGNGSFSDVARQVGVAEPFAAHSATFGDFDNDGDLDLYVSGGSFLRDDSLEVAFGPLPDVLYRNNGFDSTLGWTFKNITREAGIENFAHCNTTIWGDIDNDGDLDLFLGNSHDLRGREISEDRRNSISQFFTPPFPSDKLYRNRGNGNHYLHLKLVGHASNRAAIGARIEAYARDQVQIREVEGGGMFNSQNSLPVEFGFGTKEKVDKLIIRWPSGIVQTLQEPTIDRFLEVEEPFRFGFIQIAQATLARVRWWLPGITWSFGGVIFLIALVLGIRHGYRFIRRKIPDFGFSYLAQLPRSSSGTLTIQEKSSSESLRQTDLLAGPPAVSKIILHYKITEKLGGGGMGVVYKAQDLKLDRFVALKFLSAYLAQAEEPKKRFVYEAKAASALDHPNICTIFEINETEDGQMFIAMAYYEGETLKKKIGRGPLPLEEAINITIQVAQGLARTHEEGIFHRDIKPANIMITKRGEVKIVDFGLAKLSGLTQLTREGQTLGTVAYMSPEQARGTVVDHRTDIWSLGVVLYEMLSGQLPFGGELAQTVMYAIINDDPEPITGLRTVPIELERIVNKAMAKQASNRYESTHELLEDLRQVHQSLCQESQISIKPARETAAITLTIKKTRDARQTTSAATDTKPNIFSIIGGIFRRPKDPEK